MMVGFPVLLLLRSPDVFHLCTCVFKLRPCSPSFQIAVTLVCKLSRVPSLIPCLTSFCEHFDFIFLGNNIVVSLMYALFVKNISWISSLQPVLWARYLHQKLQQVLQIFVISCSSHHTVVWSGFSIFIHYPTLLHILSGVNLWTLITFFSDMLIFPISF